MASTIGVSGGQGSQDVLQYQRLMAARQSAVKASLIGSGDQSSPSTSSAFLRDADNQSSSTSAASSAAGAGSGLTGSGGMLSGALSGLLLHLQSLGSGGDAGTAAPAAATTSDQSAAETQAATDATTAKTAAVANRLNGANLLVFAQLQGQAA